MIDWAVVVVAFAVIATAFAIASASISRWRTPAKVATQPRSSTVHRPPSTVHQIELPLLLLLAPLFLFSSPFSVLGVAAILALWVGRWLTQGFFLPRTPLDWPLAIMCTMIPVGMLASPNMDWSVGRAGLILYGVALYYAIVAWINSPARLEMATLAYLAAGSAMAALALLGTAWQYKVPVLGDIAQWFPQVAHSLSRDSTGFHPNIVAGALLWVVLPLLALFIEALSSRKDRNDANLSWYAAALRDLRVLGALLLLTGGTLVLTQSRGALLGAAVGTGLIVYLYWPRLRPLVAAVGVVGVVVLGSLLVSWWNSRPAQYDSTTTPLSVYYDNFAVRMDIWKSALQGIREYPITGVGLDAFRRVMPVRYPAPSVPESYDIGHAHNQFLQATLDLGLPGLVGYLALWLAAGLMLRRWTVDGGRWTARNHSSLVTRHSSLVTRHEPHPPSTVHRPPSIVIALASALLASFVHGLADAVVMVSKPGVLFWAMLAILVASWRLTGIKGDPTLQE
ncbi:MAG: O-antigen ligase family protein [Chloroflexia bacterium]